LTRPVLPPLGNGIVDKAELKQVVIRNHPMDTDNSRQ